MRSDFVGAASNSLKELRVHMISHGLLNLTGRKTHPTSIPLVGRDVKYNAMASSDLVQRQDH